MNADDTATAFTLPAGDWAVLLDSTQASGSRSRSDIGAPRQTLGAHGLMLLSRPATTPAAA